MNRGTYSPNIGPATELAFELPFFGDFSADVLLGNKKEREFCVVEFEHGHQDSIESSHFKPDDPSMAGLVRAPSGLGEYHQHQRNCGRLGQRSRYTQFRHVQE